MRGRLLVVSALTCVAAGTALLTPASGQRSHPACESLVGTSCSTPGEMVVCTWEGRYLDGLYCHNGTWE